MSKLTLIKKNLQNVTLNLKFLRWTVVGFLILFSLSWIIFAQSFIPGFAANLLAVYAACAVVFMSSVVVWYLRFVEKKYDQNVQDTLSEKDKVISALKMHVSELELKVHSPPSVLPVSTHATSTSASLGISVQGGAAQTKTIEAPIPFHRVSSTSLELHSVQNLLVVEALKLWVHLTPAMLHPFVSITERNRWFDASNVLLGKNLERFEKKSYKDYQAWFGMVLLSADPLLKKNQADVFIDWNSLEAHYYTHPKVLPRVESPEVFARLFLDIEKSLSSPLFKQGELLSVVWKLNAQGALYLEFLIEDKSCGQFYWKNSA